MIDLPTISAYAMESSTPTCGAQNETKSTKAVTEQQPEAYLTWYSENNLPLSEVNTRTGESKISFQFRQSVFKQLKAVAERTDAKVYAFGGILRRTIYANEQTILYSGDNVIKNGDKLPVRCFISADTDIDIMIEGESSATEANVDFLIIGLQEKFVVKKMVTRQKYGNVKCTTLYLRRMQEFVRLPRNQVKVDICYKLVIVALKCYYRYDTSFYLMYLCACVLILG